MNDLTAPISDKEELDEYRAGQEILIRGVLYTARDKVHSIISKNKQEWPFDLKNNGIFYCGPTQKSKDFPLGSCGPTTSQRMDPYTPFLYQQGLALTVGKGPRSEEVRESIKKNKGLYLVAFGGCGSLYGSKIRKAQIIGFKQLGPQAVYKIEVRDFPVIVGIDTKGDSIFD
ncbi:MAG: FumA C-terminus/TtdB family hydratase beta subunit [Elusimicrobiota bacterium]